MQEMKSGCGRVTAPQARSRPPTAPGIARLARPRSRAMTTAEITAMDEIPHLLRRGVGTGSPEDVRDAEELMDKAADEIERLREALAAVSTNKGGSE